MMPFTLLGTPDAGCLELIAFAFLCGSIPFGYLLGRCNGIDLRQHGSRNIGATNVWRVLGRKWGLLAFVLDFLKGYLPVLLFRAYALYLQAHVLPTVGDSADFWLFFTDPGSAAASGLAAILGHNFTPWLRFKGGKGVATSAGVLAALMPMAFGVAFAAWIVVFAATRIVSISSIIAAAALPVAVYFLYRHQTILFVFALVAGLLTIVRHHANIGRLLRGEEKPVKSASAAQKP